ncbi:MAG: anthranilate phosphoribosyltransferase [Vulcanimicrobiota bacterium]
MSFLQEAVRSLSLGCNLTTEASRQAVEEIMAGGAEPGLVGAFLMGLRVKGETVDELEGAALALRGHQVALQVRRRPLVDTCGTGGDGASTFNISTVAALVVAAAGGVVAKHGNRSVSSKCGSADLLEALGVGLVSDPLRVASCVDEVGFGFLFAPHFHPAMRHVAVVRRSLGIRTVFNLLGPLSNPAGAEAQVIGVFSPEWVRPVAELAQRLGIKSCLVVHGHGGLDEFSPSGPSRVARLRQGAIQEFELHPAELALELAPLEALAGGGPAENATIARAILAGEAGPRADTVALNAAAALVAADLAEDFTAGLALARQALASGAAAGVLERLVAYTSV